MRISNIYYLEQVMEPLDGYNEYRDYDSDYQYKHIDENTDEGLRHIVHSALLPSFNRFDDFNKDIIRNTLCRILHTPNYDYGSICCFPWDIGKREKRVFELLWEECFPGQSLHDCRPAEVVPLDYCNAVRLKGKEGADLDQLLSPFIGGGKNPNDPHRFLRPYEEVVKKAYMQRLKPHFDSLSADERMQIKAALKEALEYYLTCWEWIWKSINPPFDCPNDARALFVWMWEVLFPKEPVPKRRTLGE